MGNTPRTIVFNDRHFMAKTIFEGLRSENIQVEAVKNKSNYKVKNSFLTNLYRAFFQRRLFPYISIITSIIKRAQKKCRADYNELLVVGIEDLSDLAPVYKKYSTVPNLYFWQWNPQPQSKLKTFDFWFRLNLMKLAGFKIATFDRSDADKFNLYHYPQIYSRAIAESYIKKDQQLYSKALFIGKNKGRAKKLNQLAIILDKFNVKADFRIVDEVTKEEKENLLWVNFTSQPVCYNKYIQQLGQSDIIVEITQDGQVGLTLRALESIFFNKKLITDNNNIKKYEFYNPQNIFVLENEFGDCNLEAKLSIFIRSPYHEVDKNIVDKYDVKSLLDYFRSI